jgi:hypothetical protein
MAAHFTLQLTSMQLEHPCSGFEEMMWSSGKHLEKPQVPFRWAYHGHIFAVNCPVKNS